MSELPTALEYTTVHVSIQDLVEDATAETRGKVTYTPSVTTLAGIDGKVTQVDTVRDYLIAGSSSVHLLTGITWTADFHLQGGIPSPDPVTFTTDGSTINLAYEITASGTCPIETRTVVLAGAATTAQLDELADEISLALEDKADESAVVAAQAAADAANAALPAKANAADVYDKASADARYAPSTGSAEYATKAEAASSGFSSIPAHNVTLDTRAHWREAVGRVIAGSGNAKVLIVGDSTDWGLGSGGADGYPPSKSLARLLNSSYLPTQYGFGVPAGSSAPTEDGDRDDRWSKNSDDGWAFTTWGLGSLGAYQHGGTSTSAAKTFEPGIACDTFVVYYLTNSGLGTLDLSIDGGAVTSQSTAGALGVGSVTITAASVSDAHALSIVKRVNTVFVFGVYAYDSTTPSIHMLNAGVCNSRAYQASGASWASDTYKSLSMIGALAPDLTIVRLGINDSRLASSSSADNWEAAVRTIIAKAQESGDAILCSPVPSQSTVMSSDGTTPAVTLQGQYRDRCLTIAEDLDCAYVDIFGRYGSWSDANALGFMYDSLHLTAEGSADAADALRRVIVG